MIRVSRFLFCLLSVSALACSSCFDQSKVAAPTVNGVYSMHISDSSIHHGVDILLLNSDSTYVHIYTHGSSGRDLMQTGQWKNGVGKSVVFYNFVAWDLLGGSPDGVMYPDPANTAFPLGQMSNGNYEIDAGPDFGEHWIQIERFPG
jgi:hypothetical protein